MQRGCHPRQALNAEMLYLLFLQGSNKSCAIFMQVLWNPFDDMVPTKSQIPVAVAEDKGAKNNLKKVK